MKYINRCGKLTNAAGLLIGGIYLGCKSIGVSNLPVWKIYLWTPLKVPRAIDSFSREALQQMACSSLWRAEWIIFRGAIMWQICQYGEFVNRDDLPGLSQCIQVSLGGLQICFLNVVLL